MSVIKAFFGLGKLPKVVKFFEFQSFDDVNKMGGALRAIREEARTSGAQLTKSQQKYLDDQQRQVEMVFEQLQQPTTETGIRGTQSAKIIDMQGREIPPGSKIIGGQAVDDTKMIDDAIENASPGFAKGDTKYNAELVAEDLAERMGLVYDDLDTKQRIDIYGKAYDRLSKRNFQLRQTEKQIFERLNKENKQAVGNIRKKNLRDDISKLENKKDARALQLEQRGVKDFETDDLYNNINEQINDLELKLDFEDMVDPENLATGGRVGLKNGNKKITLAARGTKSGRQQIKGAPEGITMDNETFNAIVNADIPITEKIDLLANFEYGKGRTRIEKDGQEIFMDEGGFKDRDIGLGFNKEGEGIGGTIMYDLETGDPQFNIGFRKKFEEGGRTGFKMGRRAFLKLMGGAAAGIGALKAGALKMFGKEGAKKVAKNVIKTDPVPGKPEWFDTLVTKVINEGDDVTKRFATGERQSVYQKRLGDDTVVRVTQDADEGAIRVEYESPDNVFGDPVQLDYKKPLPDEVNPNPKAEFTTAESGPVGRAQGPDDYDIEIDEVGGTSIKDLSSDLSKLKQYATGKKPTLKEFVQNKKRRDKAARISDDSEAQMDDVIRRQGEMLDDDVSTDFASGGIARMLGE